MKLSPFVIWLNMPLVFGAPLDARQQDNCNRNNCYVAVWGSDPNLVPVRGVLACERYLTTTEIVYPLVTSTFAQVTLTTTTVSCLTIPLTSTLPNLSTATPILTMPSASLSAQGVAQQINARQIGLPQSSFTTTTFGLVPTSVNGVCDTGNYRSACLCKSDFGITSGLVTLISTTSTLFVTATFTNTLTTGTPCPISSGTTSSSASLTISSGSSRSSSASGTSISSLSSSTGTSSSSSSNTENPSVPSFITGTTVSSSISTKPTGASSSTTSGLSSSSTVIIISSSSIGTLSSIISTDTSSSSPSSSSIASLSSSTRSSASSSLSLTFSTVSSSSRTTSGYPLPTPICTGNGVALCDGSCQDLRTSNDHCGLCGNACADGKLCTNGVCTSTACDSNCEMLHLCNNNNNGTSTCACARESEGGGVCFDAARFQCNGTNPRPVRCAATAGCELGFVCVEEYCACNGTTTGICVSSEGCGLTGAEISGPLVKYWQMMKRSNQLF